MEILLFVMPVRMKMDTIIPDVVQNVYRIKIVNLVELVSINVAWIHVSVHADNRPFVQL